MIVSIPSPVVFNGSTVVDEAKTLDDLVVGCKPIKITKGLEIQEGTKVFEYTGTDFVPPTYDATYEDYEVGDTVFHNCKLYRITAKKGQHSYTQYIPKEPEEYDGWDEGIAFENWRHRYVRFPNRTASNICAGSLGYYKQRWYYLYKDRCGYKFTAKDAALLGCGNNCYLSTCLAKNTTYKYEQAKDVRASVSNWCGTARTGIPGCGTYTACGGTTACKGKKLPTLSIKSIVVRNGYIYARTHLSDNDAPIQYHEIPHNGTIRYTLSEIKSPVEIKGFTQKRNVYALSVLDGKDYTVVRTSPETEYEEWNLINTQPFDTIAFGNIIAEGVSVVVTDKDGNELFHLERHPIKNALSNKRFEVGVTHIVYTNRKITEESYIKIIIHGVNIQLGDIVIGDSLDMGFTNLEFDNDFRDFSPYEQDQWGNVYYKDGVRVKRHSGTVDLPVSKYDEMVRQMDFIGGKEVIINGSDSLNNTPSNSISVFQATMLIGRFKQLKIKTSAKTNKIDDIATYRFEIEERV